MKVWNLKPLLFGLILVLGPSFPGGPGDDSLPDLPGWSKTGKMRRFSGSLLFNAIDGGAELFHEFGFEELLVQAFRKEEKEISLEVYRMSGPGAALGVYLLKSGKEVPIPGVSARHTGHDMQVSGVRGPLFVQINNPSGEGEMPSMAILLEKILKTVPQPVCEDTLFRFLPKTGRIPGSERLFRGPFGLEPFYTFGQGDVFGLEGKTFGALAEYVEKDSLRTYGMVIPLADSGEARIRFDSLPGRLDQDIRIMERTDTSILFRDFRNHYGRITRERSAFRIVVNSRDIPLSESPAKTGTDP